MTIRAPSPRRTRLLPRSRSALSGRGRIGFTGACGGSARSRSPVPGTRSGRSRLPQVRTCATAGVGRFVCSAVDPSGGRWSLSASLAIRRRRTGERMPRPWFCSFASILLAAACAGETAGGGGPCVPSVTCASQGYQCGAFVDSCGVAQQCGTCASGSACSKADGTPGVLPLLGTLPPAGNPDGSCHAGAARGRPAGGHLHPDDGGGHRDGRELHFRRAQGGRRGRRHRHLRLRDRAGDHSGHRHAHPEPAEGHRHRRREPRHARRRQRRAHPLLVQRQLAGERPRR